MIKIGVELESNLAEILERFELLPEVVEPAFNDFADAVVLAAQDQWPIDTGASFEAWESSVEVHPQEIAVILANRARGPDGRSYAAYVHRKGTAPDDVVWEEQLDEIIKTEVPRLMEDCVAIIEQMGN